MSDLQKTATPERSVAVFCAAADGTDPAFRKAATELGGLLAAHRLGLIYGGARVGLMGAVADAAAGGYVVGVIPHVLVDKENAHDGLSELHVTTTMHTRKALMGERADAFLVLPGGFGTLEELFEVLAWQTLGIHAKPVVLVNTAGFYDGLTAWLADVDRVGLLRGHLPRLLVAADAAEALRLAKMI